MRWIAMAAGGLVCGAMLAGVAAPARAGTFTVLRNFQGGSDGAGPSGGLISVGPMLYGNTGQGGGSANCLSGCGTVYAINPVGGAEVVIYAFTGTGTDGTGPTDGLLAVGKKLFGVTYDTGNDSSAIFAVNHSTGRLGVLHTFQGAAGAGNLSTLVKIGGDLYGTTDVGGAGYGFVYAIDRKTGAESTVYTFQGGSDGASPMGSMIDVGGLLYGTTMHGGDATHCDSGCGVVYAVNPKTGAEQIVHAFKGGPHDGSLPMASLINVGGTLYGTTSSGGSHNYGGTVFALDPATGKETTVYAFLGSNDGSGPVGGVIDVGGMLYGTTVYGGNPKACKDGCGTIFAVDPSTGSETVLHAFQVTDGSGPRASMTSVNGALYGTTLFGGDTQGNGDGYGTVFEYTP